MSSKMRIVLVLGVVPQVLSQGVMLWNGVQSSQFFSGISTSCDSALNTTLSCPNSVQLLASAIQFVPWNTSALTALCTSGCQSSLATLLKNVQSGCGSESYAFNGGNMSWVQQIEYFQYKYGLLCMRDTQSSKFCYDIENAWNITTMAAQGQATWPTHTTKCYLDLSESEPFYITDENHTCLGDTIFETGMFIDSSSQPVADSMAALDYYYERTEMIDDDNFGWPSALEYDEYPLQIQCSSCWVNKFIYGYSSPWGTDWDDITEQIWANMKANCNLTQTIIPANNISVFNNATVISEDLTFIADPTLCIQILNGPQNSTCQQIALEYSIPVAGLYGLNPGTYCPYLDNDTLCAPQPCPVAVNKGASMSMAYFIASYTNFTQTQFLAWNSFLDTDNIATGDTVCVGPPGGEYIPSSVATQAAPSVYTTTATPAYPTPSGSVKNCGLWYEVQSGDYCDSIALNFSLTFAQLVDLNPSLDSNCTNLYLGYDYCVAPVNGTTVSHVSPAPSPGKTSSISSGGSVRSTTTTSTATTVKSSTTRSSVTTPTPTQSGMVKYCTRFYQAVSGDTCFGIAQNYDITTDQFEGWNPAVGSSCQSLLVGYYYCVAR